MAAAAELMDIRVQLRSRAGRNEKKGREQKISAGKEKAVDKEAAERGGDASVLRSMYSTYDRMIMGGKVAQVKRGDNLHGAASRRNEGGKGDKWSVSWREKANTGAGAVKGGEQKPLPARERCRARRSSKHGIIDPDDLRARLVGAQKAICDHHGDDNSDCTLFCSSQRAGMGGVAQRPAKNAARLHASSSRPAPPSYHPKEEEERVRGRERERDGRRKAMEARREARLAGLALTWCAVERSVCVTACVLLRAGVREVVCMTEGQSVRKRGCLSFVCGVDCVSLVCSVAHAHLCTGALCRYVLHLATHLAI